MSAFLQSGDLMLRPVSREDLPLLAVWRNDAELRDRTREWRPLTDVDQESWLERISGPQRRDFMFIVQTPLGPAGCVGLCYWDAIDARAEVSFYLGDGFRGKGLCKQALTLLLDWGFVDLRLERVFAEAFAFNAVSVHILESLGFQREGCLRQHVYKRGERHDSILLGLLVTEWLVRRTAEVPA